MYFRESKNNPAVFHFILVQPPSVNRMYPALIHIIPF